MKDQDPPKYYSAPDKTIDPTPIEDQAAAFVLKYFTDFCFGGKPVECFSFEANESTGRVQILVSAGHNRILVSLAPEDARGLGSNFIEYADLAEGNPPR